MNFQIAYNCNEPGVLSWRTAVRRRLGGFAGDDGALTAALNARADREFQARVAAAGGDETAFCRGAPQQPPWPDDEMSPDGGAGPDTGGDPRLKGALPFRRNPSGLPPRRGDADAAREGGPCRDGQPCAARKDALDRDSEARYWLSRGNAELAIGNLDAARAFYERAVDTGRPDGAPASIIAAQRLQVLTLTCEFTEASIARIARDKAEDPDEGGLINVGRRQRALRALGHYRGKIDNRYGPGTTQAVRAFQREIGANETGDLTPVETVVLICSAAQNQRDVRSQNVLGVMYATGLGVVQNTDLALKWLGEAADRGDADASYNLAIIYGTGTVRQSYRLCDIVQAFERADYHLDQAARSGHPAARRFQRRYGGLTPRARWEAIQQDLDLPTRLIPSGGAC